jgi:hypothetical protein
MTWLENLEKLRKILGRLLENLKALIVVERKELASNQTHEFFA